MKPRLAITLLFLIPLLIGSAWRGEDLLKPYENGHRGACAAFFALMAKNHLRHGLATTGGVSILNPVKVDHEHFHYYMHHPPGAVMFATVGAALGGTNPIGLRLVFLPLSIGIVLLIYRLARQKGHWEGAVAASVAALTPIGVYYGAFVNFEIPTLFFLLLTLHLLLRYERRRRPKDRWRMLFAYAAAVGCDWIALGLPFCLLAIAPFRGPTEKTSRRHTAKHAGALLLVGILTAIAIKTLYHLQLARYGIDPDGGQGLFYYLSATPLARTFSWSTFADKVGGYARLLYGIPSIAIALFGLVLVSARGIRRRLDQLDVAAAAMFGIGMGNELILASHATGHDYYLLYLMPAAALFSARCFATIRSPAATDDSPMLRGRNGIATLAWVALLIQLGVQTRIELNRRDNYFLSQVGDKLHKITPDGSIVFLPHAYTSQVAVTADRFVWWARDIPELDRAEAMARRYGMAAHPVVYVIEPQHLEKLDPGLRARLLASPPPTVSGPYQVYHLGNLEP